MNDLILANLRESGLTDDSIARMQIRQLSPEQCQEALGMSYLPKSGGYGIPYFSVKGAKEGFGRVRFVPPLPLSDGKLVRYSQKKGTSTRAYLPPFWSEAIWKDAGTDLWITEGEKKAAKACQEGLVCLGLGGVDSWRCKTFDVEAESVEPHPTKEGRWIVNKVSRGRDIRSIQEKVAQELLDITLQGRRVFIVFDSDTWEKPRIQSAVFELDCWLYTQDCRSVVQVILPARSDGSKRGLDDFLMEFGIEALADLERVQPYPPNVKSWLRDELAGKKLDRNGLAICARAVAGSVFNRGDVFRDPDTREFFYFNRITKTVADFEVSGESLKDLNNTTFGTHLHREYGVGESDAAVLRRSFEYVAHSPAVRAVKPRRACWATDDTLYHQISDSRLVRVTADSIDLVDNGTDDMLFRPGDVEPIEVAGLLACRPQLDEPRWLSTVRAMPNIAATEALTLDETRLYLAILCYLNPWFRRWRGMMLPIEIFNSAAGGGKSTLFELRKGILTGRSALNSAPIDKKDWYASLTNTAGFWVWDNATAAPKGIENMSEELCRMITSPNPTIEMRKYYTTNKLINPSIDLTFAVTCTHNPFVKTDLLERSACFQMQVFAAGKDGNWVVRQLRDRAKWLVDHYLIAQRFLGLVRDRWSDSYLSINRLPQFEQAVLLMGAALGEEEGTRQLIGKFEAVNHANRVRYDPVMKALLAFANWCRVNGKATKFATAADVCERGRWDKSGAYSNVKALDSAAALGSYMGTNEAAVEAICRIRRHWIPAEGIFHLEILP